MLVWFGLNNRNTSITPAAGAMMGNFDAFTQIKHASTSNPLGPLQKVVSIGGYGHDATFEDAFNYKPNSTGSVGMDNFVRSTQALVNAFDLAGIDLDYEDPAMTHQQSEQYLTLIKQLRAAMPGKLITVTMLSDPDYAKGMRDGSAGFASGVLAKIAPFW
jgi:GH18 family chitinase